jgi:type II secretory pathway pseudopilin PulG
MTLLELVIATSLLAVVLTSVTVILRTGRQAWEAHEADFIRVEAAHATLRHVVRAVRQADAVAQISAATDNSGRLSLSMPNNEVRVWDHDAATRTVNFGVTNPSELLATDITGLRFVGYRADGATTTTVPDEIQAVEAEVAFQLPVAVGGGRTIRSWAWVRSW